MKLVSSQAIVARQGFRKWSVVYLYTWADGSITKNKRGVYPTQKSAWKFVELVESYRHRA